MGDFDLKKHMPKIILGVIALMVVMSLVQG